MASLKTDKVEQDDGFTKVGGFKYAPVRGRGGKKRRGQRGAAAPASAEEQLEEAKQKLERRRDIVQGKQRLLDEGDLGQRIRDSLAQALGPPASAGEAEASEESAGSSRPQRPQHILCLGLGSVKDSRVAQIQLALLLIMRSHLGPECKVEAYDPVWNDDDRSLLSALDIVCLEENKHAAHALEQPTLVYMPHCGRTLYESLLRSNWSEAGLGRVTLCCNGLARYADLAQDLEKDSPCVARILLHLYSQPLPSVPSPNHDALNDLEFQYFSPQPPKGDAAEPTTADTLTAQLSSLKLSLPSSFWELPPPSSPDTKDAELQ